MGFIKLDRKILNWEWYKNKNTRLVFLHLLLTANYEPGEWRGIKYGTGECLTSLPKLATECSLTIQQVRTSLSNMKLTGEITERIVGKCRVITINNWSLYQTDNMKNNRKVTGNQQDNQQESNRESNTSLRNKEYKEEKNKYYDDANLDKAFSDYVDMRKKIKKPMTDHAIDLAKKKLKDLSGGDTQTAIKIVEQSILGSWQGLFPLKQEQKKNKFSNFTERKYNFDELEGEIWNNTNTQ